MIDDRRLDDSSTHIDNAGMSDARARLFARRRARDAFFPGAAAAAAAGDRNRSRREGERGREGEREGRKCRGHMSRSTCRV